MAQKKQLRFDMDAALDGIDYSFPGYTPSKDSIEFFNLMRLIQGKDFEFKTPLSHYFMIDVLFGLVPVEQFPYTDAVKETISLNKKRISFVCSRGLAKSTVITCMYPIYCAVMGKTPNGVKSEFHLLLAASTQGGARVMAKAVEAMCAESTFCKEYFQSMRFTETEAEFVRKGKGSAADRTFLARFMGFSSGVRGSRSSTGVRPDKILLDDVILNTQAAYSPVQMAALESLIHSDAVNALIGGGKGMVISVSTPFHLGDAIVKLTTSGAFTPVLLPVCEKITGDTKVKDIVSAWPDMHPPQAIKEQYEQANTAGKLQSFMQERMLRVTSEEQRMVPDNMIQTYERQLVIKNIERFTVLITTDFTASNDKTGDFSGICVWAIGANDNKYIIDVWLRKSTIQEQFDELFRMVGKWSKGGRIIEVGIEIDGQQQLNVFTLKKMMLEKNVWFNLARQKGHTNREGILSRAASGSKLDRFRALLPQFELRKIWFPEDLINSTKGTGQDIDEMLHELRLISFDGFGSVHDDGNDLLSQINLIDYVPPSGTSDELSSKHTNSMWGEAWFTEEEEDKNSMVF